MALGARRDPSLWLVLAAAFAFRLWANHTFANLAWPMVEGLRIAAELDGGLNRTNFILGLRAMDLDNPGLLEGIKFAMDGNDDAYFIEGSDFSRYDAAGETWVQEGGIVDLNGSSPNCEWGQSGEAGC